MIFGLQDLEQHAQEMRGPHLDVGDLDCWELELLHMEFLPVKLLHPLTQWHLSLRQLVKEEEQPANEGMDYKLYLVTLKKGIYTIYTCTVA